MTSPQRIKWSLAALLALAGPLLAEPRSFDFDAADQNRVESLQKNHAWVFAEPEQFQVATLSKDAFLRLGGKSEGKPSVRIPLPKPMPAGTLTLTAGTTASAADAVVRVLDGNVELFALRLQARNIVRVEADQVRTFTAKTNDALDIAVLGKDGQYANRLEATFAWQDGVLTYALSQPDSPSATKLDTGDVRGRKFKTAGAPDAIVIETNKHDDESRDVLLFKIEVK